MANPVLSQYNIRKRLPVRLVKTKHLTLTVHLTVVQQLALIR
jgi:hypothetical protein